MVHAHSLQTSFILILFILLLVNSGVVSSKEPPPINYSYDPSNKTATILKEGIEIISVEQVSTSPDLLTMEEVFKITFHTNTLSIADLGTNTNHLKAKGKKEFKQSRTEWFILEDTSDDIIENIYGNEPRGETISGIESAENITEVWGRSPTILQYGTSVGKIKWNLSKHNTNFTPTWYQVGFDNYAGMGGKDIILNSTEETIKSTTYFGWNETAIIGTNIITRHKGEWRPLNKNDTKTRNQGESITLKVKYHKEAETKAVQIQTIPSFYGINIPELTWWNTSWEHAIHNTISDGARPYQLSVNITNGTGTNNITDVFVNCEATNCSDIRFTLDNTSELPYWIETNITSLGNRGKVWVNLTGNGTVSMYYGNTVANSVSNAATTFIQVIGNDSEQPVVGAWDLDGNAIDSSGNNNHGTTNGTLAYTTGLFGKQAGDFNGIDNYIEIADNAILNFNTTDEMSISAQVQADAYPPTTGIAGIVSKWNSGADCADPTKQAYILSVRSTGKVLPGVNSDTGEDNTYDGTNTIGTTGWNQVVFTVKDGSNNWNLYINNTLDATNTKIGVGIFPGSSTLRIGSTFSSVCDPNPYLNGKIQHVRLYNRVLTSDEIFNKYNNYGYVTTAYPGRELIKRYTSPEPVWSTWGTEQTSPPIITSYSNNITYNQSLATARVNISTPINFNATTDQTITTWAWWKDGVEVANNFNNYTVSWSTLGVKNISLIATSVNGNSSTLTWTPTVSDITAPTMTSESVNPTQGTPGATTTITGNFIDDTNISSAKVKIQTPNATSSNYTTSCTPSGNTSACTLDYTDTDANGVYTIQTFYPTDGSGNQRAISSSLTYTTFALPIINTWANNITNNDSLVLRVNMSTPINFNATADQTITTWVWYKDGVNQNNNLQDINISWSTLGIKTIDLTVTNINGTSLNKTWTVTVSDITDPWLTNKTVGAPAIAINASNNISANFTDDTNISTAIVRIQAPGATTDYAMTCSASGNTSSCYYVTSDTPSFGTYAVLYYSVTDGSGNTVNLTTTNSFIVSPAPHILEWSNTLTQNSTLSAIRANISTSIGFSITTDATVQYYTWSKDGIVQGGENGQSFTTSWNTLGNKNVSVTATNPSGTSLATTWSVNITDITAPWLTSSSTDSINHYVQGYPVTISAAFADDTNISSAKVHVINPDLSEANWTMTCGVSGSTASCNLAYTTTMNVGVYQISSFYPVDGTSNQRNITPGLSFTTQPPLAGGSTGEGNREEEPDTTAGGGGSGKTGATPQPTTSTALNASTEPDTKINFTDIREGATEPTAIDIASCLTDSLVMTNKCSSLNYGVVVEPFNWWVAIGAYLFSLGIIFIQTIRTDKPREWLKESIIYGTFTVILSAVLVSVGLNVYIVNYLIDSPKYFYTFLNFGIYGAFIAVIGDSYFYRKDKKTYKLKKKVSILEDF